MNLYEGIVTSMTVKLRDKRILWWNSRFNHFAIEIACAGQPQFWDKNDRSHLDLLVSVEVCTMLKNIIKISKDIWGYFTNQIGQ